MGNHTMIHVRADECISEGEGPSYIDEAVLLASISRETILFPLLNIHLSLFLSWINLDASRVDPGIEVGEPADTLIIADKRYAPRRVAAAGKAES